MTKTPTPRVERMWARAELEAERRGHDHVGTEHVLLALADDPEGAAGWLLLALGVRDELSRNLNELLDTPRSRRRPRRLASPRAPSVPVKPGYREAAWPTEPYAPS